MPRWLKILVGLWIVWAVACILIALLGLVMRMPVGRFLGLVTLVVIIFYLVRHHRRPGERRKNLAEHYFDMM